MSYDTFAIEKKTMRKKEKNGKSFHYYEINRYNCFQRSYMDCFSKKNSSKMVHPLSKSMATVICYCTP